METILLAYPNGFCKSYSKNEFTQFGNELEHNDLNITLDLVNPNKSFVYETDFRGEIVFKENVHFVVI